MTGLESLIFQQLRRGDWTEVETNLQISTQLVFCLKTSLCCTRLEPDFILNTFRK